MLRAVAVLFLASLLCRVESQVHHLCQSATSRPQESVFPGNQTAPYNVLVVEDDNACHNPGPLEVNVTWRRPQVKSPIKAYKIHVISVSGSDNTANLPGDVTSHVVDSMECWNAYILRVEAVFESGQSAFSNATFHATGNRTLRYFPQDLRAVEGDKKCHGHAENTSVVLHWKPAILGHNFTVMGYKLEIYFVNGTTKAFDLPSTAAEFEYENVPCNGTTVFGVSAVLLLNAAFPHGTEGLFIYPAAYVAVSYGRYELPLVQNLRARVQGATSIKVQWTPPAEGAVEYRVSAEAVHAPPLVVFTNDTSVTFRHLTPGKEYTIRVATANTVNGKTSYGTYVEVNATTNVLQPPSEVEVFATCDHRVVASWKNSDDALSGFELKFCEQSQKNCVHRSVAATDNATTFHVSSPLEVYTVHIQSCIRDVHTWNCSEPVVRSVSAFGQDPAVEYLQASFVNDTSLNVTWGTEHVGKIHISVCPVSPHEKNCASYTTNGDSLEYQVDVVGHDTAYEVRAKFSTSVGYIPCYHEESSVNVKRPAAGGHNSGSTNEVCGLLTLGLLLLCLMKSSYA